MGQRSGPLLLKFAAFTTCSTECATANHGAWFQIGSELLRCQNTVVVFAYESVTFLFVFFPSLFAYTYLICKGSYLVTGGFVY